MKYLSIDLETTGLDPEKCQIIEFGAVLDDTKNPRPMDELPVYHAYIKPEDGNLYGNVFALNLNAGIIEKLKNEKDLSDEYKFIYAKDLAYDFLFWLKQQGFEIKQADTPNYYTESLNIAGKNFSSFDKRFLDKIPQFNDLIRIRHRVLDPAVLYFDARYDEALPDLKTCKDRAGIKGAVTHLAVDDAKDVILLIRKHYKLGEFSGFTNNSLAFQFGGD